jgi:hypothetical protein
MPDASQYLDLVTVLLLDARCRVHQGLFTVSSPSVGFCNAYAHVVLISLGPDGVGRPQSALSYALTPKMSSAYGKAFSHLRAPVSGRVNLARFLILVIVVVNPPDHKNVNRRIGAPASLYLIARTENKSWEYPTSILRTKPSHLFYQSKS